MSLDETFRYCVSAAERLRQQHPDRFVLVLVSELTLLMQGIVPVARMHAACWARHNPLVIC
jgi:hypothetical protein